MYFETLKEVAVRLNKVGCSWAVGGSLVLYFNGLWKCPNDIDILIDLKDVDDVMKGMEGLGEFKELKGKEPFRTEKFFGYNINGIDVEFMCNFKIKTGEKAVYEFILDEAAIVDRVEFKETLVNVTSLEDWMVAYLVMGDPKKRVPIIEEYFSKYGIKHRNLLERNLNGYMPEHIKDRIGKVLK